MSTDALPKTSALPRLILSLGVFLALVVLLAVGLTLNPREVPSPLINKPAPAFTLPQLHAPQETFSPADMRGRVWMLNVWASWCVSCRQEHPALVELARSGAVPVYGLNYKDGRDEGMAWLKRLGDPYLISAFDAKGQVGIDYGVYGVPETYVIDKRGIIRYKNIGPLTPDILQEKVLPLVRELERDA
jgi:cytochrome c biogenesis protein CcmG/thiol:disulfide interchange protein DsbE